MAVAAEVVDDGHPLRCLGRGRGRRPRRGLVVALAGRLDPDLVAAGAGGGGGGGSAAARGPPLHSCPGWRSQGLSYGAAGSDHRVLSIGFVRGGGGGEGPGGLGQESRGAAR